MTKAYFALAATALAFTPASLKVGKKPPEFMIKQVTAEDADALGHEMFRRNIRPISTEYVRSIMINELFETVYPDDEEKATEAAGILEMAWDSESVYEEEIVLWRERLSQWYLDRDQGMISAPKPEMPQRHIPIRARAKSQELGEMISNASVKIRELLVAQRMFNDTQNNTLFRLLCTGWSGLKTSCLLEETDAGEGMALVSEASFNALRAEIGKDAWRELVVYVNGMFEISKEEEKNSDSPLGSESEMTGSREPSGELDSSVGNSTESPSGQAPEAESEKITEKS